MCVVCLLFCTANERTYHSVYIELQIDSMISWCAHAAPVSPFHQIPTITIFNCFSLRWIFHCYFMAIRWKFSTTMFGCNFNDFNDLPLALKWALPLLIYLRTAVANALVAIVCAAVTITVIVVMMMTTTIVPYCWFLRCLCCRPSLPPSSVRLLSNQFNVCSVIKLLQINSTHWYRSARTRQAASQPHEYKSMELCRFVTVPLRL